MGMYHNFMRQLYNCRQMHKQPIFVGKVINPYRTVTFFLLLRYRYRYIGFKLSSIDDSTFPDSSLKVVGLANVSTRLIISISR